MQKRRTWIIGGGVLGAVWALVGAAAWGLRSVETTPASVIAFVESIAWDELSAEDRMDAIHALADRVNRLPPEGKMDGELGEVIRQRFEAMNRNEQDQYLDRTLPQGFEQMMQAINEMSREQRRALVNEALRDMNEEIARGTPRREDLPMQRIIDEGMRSYLSDASAEAKLDLQPLIQRMQAVLQEAH